MGSSYRKQSRNRQEGEIHEECSFIFGMADGLQHSGADF